MGDPKAFAEAMETKFREILTSDPYGGGISVVKNASLEKLMVVAETAEVEDIVRDQDEDDEK